jgi:hypothetical protein
MEEKVCRVVFNIGNSWEDVDYKNAVFYRIKKFEEDRFYTTCFDSGGWYALSDKEKNELESKGVENIYDYLEHLLKLKNIAYELEHITDIVIE